MRAGDVEQHGGPELRTAMARRRRCPDAVADALERRSGPGGCERDRCRAGSAHGVHSCDDGRRRDDLERPARRGDQPRHISACGPQWSGWAWPMSSSSTVRRGRCRSGPPRGARRVRSRSASGHRRAPRSGCAARRSGARRCRRRRHTTGLGQPSDEPVPSSWSFTGRHSLCQPGVRMVGRSVVRITRGGAVSWNWQYEAADGERAGPQQLPAAPAAGDLSVAVRRRVLAG